MNGSGSNLVRETLGTPCRSYVKNSSSKPSFDDVRRETRARPSRAGGLRRYTWPDAFTGHML